LHVLIRSTSRDQECYAFDQFMAERRNRDGIAAPAAGLTATRPRERPLRGHCFIGSGRMHFRRDFGQPLVTRR
jgi:hypothetical protein